jgi:hypothetical protein
VSDGLSQYVPNLLIPAGVGLQYMRASANPVARKFYPAAVLGVVALVYALTWEWSRSPREEAILAILTLFRYAGEVCGGTFFASKGASSLVSAGANPDHPMIPVTFK